MKLLRNILALSFIFCFAKGAEQSVALPEDMPFSAEELQTLEQKKKYLDLTILLDPDGQETPVVPGKPIGYRLVMALSQKVAPVITTLNLVENCCLWQQQHKALLDDVKQAILADYTTAFEKAKVLCTAACEKAKPLCSEAFDPLTAVVLSLVDYNDWDCFINENNSFVLFIPKSYISHHSSTSMTDDEKIKECGFNSANLKKINNPSAQVLYDNASAARRTGTVDDIVASLTSMLVPQKKLFQSKRAEKSDIMQVWNIYIGGHGGSSKTKKDLSDIVSKSSKELSLIENTLQRMAPYIDESEFKNRYEIGQKIFTQVKKKSDNDNKLLSKVEHLPETALVPGTAHIAGIPSDDFAKILGFLENDIYTAYLHYATCFGGGQNRTFVNDTLSKLQASFIVSAEGVNEQSIYGYAFQFKPSKDNSTFIMSGINLFNFFNLLNAFFGDTTAFISTQAVKQQLQKDPIATILTNIVPLDSMSTNQPAVRIPSVGIFSPLSVDKSVKILTNSIAKAHEFEGKIIDYLDPEIKSIILYPTQVGVTLRIKPLVDIISPTQEKNVREQKAIHILKKVICKNGLPMLLYNFINSNPSLYKITFYLKELECLNFEKSEFEGDKNQQLIIKNMIITIEGNKDVIVNIAFIHNNKKYSYNFTVANMFFNKKSLLDPLKGITASKSTNNYDAIAQEVGVIDTTFEVQQPGSLKKVLFVQKLSGLEAALDPEQVEQERAWLAKNNKPAAAFANTLNRHKTELSGVIEQINKIPAQDLNQKDRDELLQRANAINARISQELALFAPATQIVPVVAVEPVVKPVSVAKPAAVKKEPVLISKKPIFAPVVKPAQTVVKMPAQEEKELRQAVIDYKKNKNRAQAEQTINKYASQYPNDPIVKAKLNEKQKFDATNVQPVQPVPVVKPAAVKKEPVLISKKPIFAPVVKPAPETKPTAKKQSAQDKAKAEKAAKEKAAKEKAKKEQDKKKKAKK